MLIYRERPAAEQPAGLLILHHGRGSDEHDLLRLADALDPERRLHVVTPRAPLTMYGSPPAPSPGYHWYQVPRVGYPDPDSFRAAYEALAELHDELWAQTGIDPLGTVLGGFSMGAVMSLALGLGPDRPRPAGLLVFSGFLPTLGDWQPDLATRQGLRTFIAHGRQDPVIDVAFARTAEQRLREGGLDVSYHESDGGHRIYPALIPTAAEWLDATLQERA
jgi:phospholipase/carboxylesterase